MRLIIQKDQLRKGKRWTNVGAKVLKKESSGP